MGLSSKWVGPDLLRPTRSCAPALTEEPHPLKPMLHVPLSHHLAKDAAGLMVLDHTAHWDARWRWRRNETLLSVWRGGTCLGEQGPLMGPLSPTPLSTGSTRGPTAQPAVTGGVNTAE
ncbi:hypothetical protein AAFF_G00091160 [Aldrovandia affinis]|uniref:Uncharacterized protein n=1 Tax=Aldrovandia affinis TaxID=143900 RepID=A0AAD7RVW9_9TELE|nr:hypothetical protein AAFF_G00091160 [Aldrovandia affinis]